MPAKSLLALKPLLKAVRLQFTHTKIVCTCGHRSFGIAFAFPAARSIFRAF